MDGIAWLRLGVLLSLGNSVLALVLQSEGKDSSDGVFVCLLLSSVDSDSVG